MHPGMQQSYPYGGVGHAAQPYGGLAAQGGAGLGTPCAMPGGFGTPATGQQVAGNGPSQPLTMIAPANAFAGEAGRYNWCRVAYAGGVDLRTGPSVEAPKTGETLCQNATFAASEEILGHDSRVYLRLADGRGWAFDDSAIFPHDPSVMRGYWQPVGLAPANSSGTAPASSTAPAAGCGGMQPQQQSGF